MRKLGSNPLKRLHRKGAGTLTSIPRDALELRQCRRRERSGELFVCRSTRARFHGRLGNLEETKRKCTKCHVREL